MPLLSSNSYGKSRVRLVRVRRDPGPTELLEWTVWILFTGHYEDAYQRGDNSAVLPTDTMKNTVYSLARSSAAGSPEEFAGELARHFLQNNPETEQVTIRIAEKPWERLASSGQLHPSAFVMPGQELRMARVRASREHSDVRSGFRHLIIMKTADSGFEGFKRDRLTTLGATADRLLATDASADWGYAVQAPAFREIHRQVRETLLTSFANHQSRSVQHTLYAMGEAVLTAIAAVADIRLTMPNIHCLPVDLSRFGQDNPNEIFVPVDEPHGYIRAHIKR